MPLNLYASNMSQKGLKPLGTKKIYAQNFVNESLLFYFYN